MKKENKTKEITTKKEWIRPWDGKKFIKEYNSNNKLIKQTVYYANKKRWIDEFDKDNGNLLKITYYRKDGTIDLIEEYRKQDFKIDDRDEDDNIIKKTYYDNDNNVTNVEYYEGIDRDEFRDGYYVNRDNDGDDIDD